MLKVPIYTIDSKSFGSQILDFIRFLAAFVVFLFHFYVPLPGYQAVMIFFVLSGYFISSSILRVFIGNKWKWSDYFINRIIRLWIVLLPGLLLTFFWGKLQMNLFGIDQKIQELSGLSTFIGNLFFLQGILVEPYGLNGPLWSLSYEFWYYVLFPILILSIVSKKFLIKLFYLLFFIGISIFIGEKIILYFFVWLVGAIIPFIKPININNKIIKLFLLSVSLGMVIVSFYPHLIFGEKIINQILRDIAIGLTFAILMYLIISIFREPTSRGVKYNISKDLAGFSYTLYVMHYPVANFIFTWLASPYWPFKATPLWIKILFAILVIFYTWFISLLTERHTDNIKKYVSYRINKRRSKAMKNLSF